MPADTLPMLTALLSTHPDLELIERRIWEAWDRDEIGSPVCRQLLGQLRERRQRIAEERRRLAEEFDRVEPAADGVEAPDWQGG